jgi:ABC-type antimicrobial peptide transport system permease subunit
MTARPVTPKPSGRWPWTRRARPPKYDDPLQRLEQFDAMVDTDSGDTSSVSAGASVSTAPADAAPAAPPPHRRTERAPAEPEPEPEPEPELAAGPAGPPAAASVPEVEESPDPHAEGSSEPQGEADRPAPPPAATGTGTATAARSHRRRRWRRGRDRAEQLDLGLGGSSKTKKRQVAEVSLGEAAAAGVEVTSPGDGGARVRPDETHEPSQQLELVTGADHARSLTRPSTISSGDLVNEAVAGLFSRPTRTLLTVLGTMIGLTALVATLGLSRTAGSQIVGRFDEIAATEVDVTPRPIDLTQQSNDLPWDAAARLQRLNGVVAAGSMANVDVGDSLVTTAPIQDPTHQSLKLGVAAVSPSLFTAVRAKLGAGRFFDEGHSQRADRVAVLGASAAQQLGITDLNTLPAIQIGPDPFLVIGIVDDVARVDKLMSSVMIPEGTARALYHLRVPDTVVIETKIGANGLIADQAPTALLPENPRGLKVIAQPDLTEVRASVSGDLDLLFLMLGAVSLLVGAIGIANVTLVSVMERTGEIGLRRALGATRRHVALQFLVESTAMGFVGGILGASLGILIVVAVSAFQGWTPVIDAYIPFVAPVIGGLIGLVAGSYPARRAASMEPVEALRSGT